MVGCFEFNGPLRQYFSLYRAVSLGEGGGWSGGATVLGKLPLPRRPTIRVTVGQGPTVRVGVVWTFYSHLSFLSSFSLSLGDGPI